MTRERFMLKQIVLGAVRAMDSTFASDEDEMEYGKKEREAVFSEIVLTKPTLSYFQVENAIIFLGELLLYLKK